jgi:hypothetical protein
MIEPELRAVDERPGHLLQAHILTILAGFQVTLE